MTIPKVFISYSWKPEINKTKTLKLAERLSCDGVHVIIDEWDLKHGHDKNQFMEKMVNEPEVKHVLIICNKDYAEKANSKKGGVGIESLIVSGEIYSNTIQTKFLPVIFEYENSEACVPTFIKSRIYYDLSSEDIFELEYEKLIRTIFEKPLSKRPPIGTMPTFLLSEDPVFVPTAHKVERIRRSLLDGNKNTTLYIQDYLNTFVESLKNFEVNEEIFNDENINDILMKGIEDLKSLRDDFINFTEMYLANSVKVDVDQLHSFFERLLSYRRKLSKARNQYNPLSEMATDHFKFFYQELFLTFCAILVSKERFNELAYILQTPFLLQKKWGEDYENATFSEFRDYNEYLNKYRKDKLKINSNSVVANTIKERTTANYNFDLLKMTDLLLWYISRLFPVKRGSYDVDYWFPDTSSYRTYDYKILPKTVSTKYFNKAKILFGIEKKEELRSKIAKERDLIEGFNDGKFLVPGIERGLNYDNMCTLA